MYEALTKAYNERNAKENKRNKDKVFSYSLLDHKSFCKIKGGKCCNVLTQVKNIQFVNFMLSLKRLKNNRVTLVW